ncbi:peroxiredoxin [Chondromyces apiculatus]|uniref:thioredoxin-dependent peroxiredoxin n=1 Tax=Chondromyces apiculatus DSM 436 TaxID=1192034 RepID=A0A017T4N1_9BACT|nr:peroxiredoxin [Chondromyces apiculatus]EYF04179.1 Thiol peroxidase, Bcp-type [Chondromyces apiculatus DSM 436]
MSPRAHLATLVTLAALATSSVACNEPSSSKPAPEAKTTAADPHAALVPLKPGDAAPDATLKLHDGKEVKLSSLAGKQVLIYFYPKDDTPGCTVQAEGLRDGWADLQAAGLDVYGVSTQGAQSHEAFIDKYKLPFPLVIDEDGAVARAFHVPMRGSFASRQSFLIGKDGKIKSIWLEVDPKEHAATVLAAAKS